MTFQQSATYPDCHNQAQQSDILLPYLPSTKIKKDLWWQLSHGTCLISLFSVSYLLKSCIFLFLCCLLFVVFFLVDNSVVSQQHNQSINEYLMSSFNLGDHQQNLHIVEKLNNWMSYEITSSIRNQTLTFKIQLLPYT